MFDLITINDTIRIEPTYFKQDFTKVLIDEINAKYSNKVILNYGLCIAFYDFLNVEQGVIFPGDGACHCKVRFRYILFRPIEGEVIVGKIVTCNKYGLRVSIDFMEDIWIPSHNLPQPSEYNTIKRIWIWSYTDEETGKKEDFEIFVNSIVKLKVTGIRFNKLEKDILTIHESVDPVMNENESSENRHRTQSIDVAGPEIKLQRSSSIDIKETLGVLPVPMTIIMYGDISEDGLGLLSWWEEDLEQQEQQEIQEQEQEILLN